VETAFAILTQNNLDVALWLHTDVDPSPAEWEGALAQLADLKTRRGGSLAKARSLVLTDGGAPNATQRSQFHQGLLGGEPHRTSLVTVSLSNPIKRSVAQVITWINPSFRTYAPNEMLAALAHLDLPPTALRGLWPEIHRLQGSLRSLQTVRFVGAMMGVADPSGSSLRTARQSIRNEPTQGPRSSK
jgi:hypothetical protein